MDLPVITEATNEFFRTVYADAELRPIFKGKNMLVLRKHTAYMINELAQYDLPMPPRQVEQLNKIHRKVIAKYKTTKRHFERMQSYLMQALEASGAEPEQVTQLKDKLLPLCDVFPADDSSDASTGSTDELVTLHQQEQGQQLLNAAHEASQQQQQQQQQEAAAEEQKVVIKSQHAHEQQAEMKQQQKRRCLACNYEPVYDVPAIQGSRSSQQRQQKGGWCCFAAMADM